jgi:hypothetical protein
MPENSVWIRTSPRDGTGTLEARSSTVRGDVNQTEMAERSPTEVDDIAISTKMRVSGF